MHPLARHIARDGGVIGFTGDFIDFVDVDDAALGGFDVHVGGLDDAQQDVLHILADIARFGERGRVGDGEWHIQDTRQRLRQQRLAAACGTNQQDVALLQFDLVAHACLDPLVVVVDGDG